MTFHIDLILSPEEAANEQVISSTLAAKCGISEQEIGGYTLLRRSLDARGKKQKYLLHFLVWTKEEKPESVPFERKLQNVFGAKPVAIIGSGPAGLFAGLSLIASGYKPVIIEQGKDVRMRRRDLALLNKTHVVNEFSNYCFGEGGAGTYSDGKLYTRSGKRGDTQKILNTLIAFGADPSIGIDAHPHIGTNKLPGIIENIRSAIIASGGEVHFNQSLTDFEVSGGSIKSILIRDVQSGHSTKVAVEAMILATGHSARIIFSLLDQKQIAIECKPFALGVRIEHPQNLIDKIQYHCDQRSPYLPPAAYSLTTQSAGRGVYSFCMCPGGIVTAAATAPGEVVVNGWSPSKRNNPYANSGMVVAVDEQDFAPFVKAGALRGMHYQSSIEQAAYKAGGSSLQAPAQRVMDFINNKHSNTLPDCSYFPGVQSVNIDDVLTAAVTAALRDGLKQFGKKMHGYLTNEAIMVATESRTSSPVRIPRDKINLMHPEVGGFFPCGEGAGYAGGIMSAAIDGEKCAAAAAAYLRHK